MTVLSLQENPNRLSHLDEVLAVLHSNFLTKSSLIFINVHLRKGLMNIEMEQMPEVPQYRSQFPSYRSWDHRKVYTNLEYDRKSRLYLEMFTLCKKKEY